MRTLLTIVLLTLGLLPPSGHAAPPNILLIFADDVGCETLGSYGGQSYKTPHLDRLAKQGLQFSHCFSMPVCHPTRVCLLTGRYPFRLENPKWGTFPKSAETSTFASYLQRAGYRTAISGKWQLTMLRDDPQHPHRLGFDDYCMFGWHEGPRYYRPMIYTNGKVNEAYREQYGPDVYTEFLIKFMKRHRNRPFLAVYSMAFCHDVTDDLKAPVPVGPQGRYDNYKEMLEGMDTRVGRLMKALDELKLSKNTIVLFTTDNGTPRRYIAGVKNGKLYRLPFTSRQNNKEVVGGKGKLTDAGTHVPLIVRWPGKVIAGSTTKALVDSSDFYATFLELAGTKSDQAVDGRSFADVLTGQKEGARQWAFAEHRGNAFVRTHRWKHYQDGRIFDVANDPLEKRPKQVKSLGAKAQAEVNMLRKALEELRR